jgi:YidC/Oxa1 family membrane protein insertase
MDRALWKMLLAVGLAGLTALLVVVPLLVAAPADSEAGLPDALKLGEVKDFDKKAQELSALAESAAETEVQKEEAALALLKLARLYESRAASTADWRRAVDAYERFTKRYGRSPYVFFAHFRIGEIHNGPLRGEPEAEKKAESAYSRAWPYFRQSTEAQRPVVWVKEGDRYVEKPVEEVVGPRLDRINQSKPLYRVLDVLSAMTGRNPRYSCAIAVIIFAFLTRILLWPLTTKQLKSQRAMQRLQPQIKELQKQYRDDQKTFQQEVMQLYKREGTNPFSGCLPMLVQLPILWFVYSGIRQYIWQFHQSSFLWAKNLAAPDMPLFVMYVISMVVFQELSMRAQPPPSDPQQEQTQKMMKWMMPLMFFFFFRGFPAGFILYWLATNVIYTAQQLWFMKVHPLPVEADDRRARAPQESQAASGDDGRATGPIKDGDIVTMAPAAKRTKGRKRRAKRR